MKQKETEDKEQYRIKEGGIDVEVKITGKKGEGKKYELILQKVPLATSVLLDQVKQDLIATMHFSTDESDPKSIEKMKEKFAQKAKELLDKKLPALEPKMEKNLLMTLMKDMLGLGDVEIVLNDPNLEEVVITSSSEPVRVFHKKYGWLVTNILPKNEEQIRDYGNTIARKIGRQVTTLNPLLDAHLTSGDRANAVLYPISSKGNTIVLRKFARDPWTMVDFITNKTADVDTFALIWFATQFESNILVSGGTASGKTSMLNACMPFIPPNHRIISIEDTRE